MLDALCRGRPRGGAPILATSIENRLLSRQSKLHLLLRFQAGAQLRHTPLEGLAAVDETGRLMWMNAAGRSLPHAPQSSRDASTLTACGGNVSRAARELGVSCGLTYRQLRPARKTC